MASFYEERRADRAAGRAEDREDRRAEREERRRDREAAERARRDAQNQARERAELNRARRRERRTQVRRRLAGEGDTLAALAVMACSIVPAVYYQVTALAAVPGLPTPIALALAVMLEAGAWVATIAGERARREARPVGRFRAAMWGCAALAAGVNFAHAPATPFHWLAVVLAAASFGGVGFWELRGMGRHGHAARTREQRAAERARRAHERGRRAMGEVWKRYEQILTAHPFGALDTETAWQNAWLDVHGAEVAVTAEVLRTRLAAADAIGGVLAAADRTPERVAVDLLLRDLFGTRPDDDGPTGRTHPGRPAGGPTGGTPTAVTAPVKGAKPQVESQMPPTGKRGADGRRRNGGTPPKRTRGDTAPYSSGARRAMSDSARTNPGKTT
jgi:hypothetical protein